MDKIVKRPLLSDARKHDLLNQQKRLPNRIKVDHFCINPLFFRSDVSKMDLYFLGARQKNWLSGKNSKIKYKNSVEIEKRAR